VREWTDSLGPLAPLAYVAIAAGLGMMLVPGPILAGASGVLFGALLGSFVTLAAAVLSAVGSLLVAERTGREGVDELTGERYATIAEMLRRHGTIAVIVQRLAPGVPDAPCSYAAGLVGISVWQIALGTLIGSAPRAFSYTALGSTLDDPTSPIGIAAIAGIILTGIVGAAIAGRLFVRWRRPENREAPLD
jgi:uncharacterized membrane protein YdjX (TVP38/TMEM64 family)